MLEVSPTILNQIHAEGEEAYPEEGAGFLLGKGGEIRQVQATIRLPNAREDTARHRRYLITADDMVSAEKIAEERNMEIIGVYHSHPDHPNRPSEYDLEWALPWFSYVITSVHEGRALDSRSWRLKDDRTAFVEEKLVIE
ncbi:MAG: M67 family metallopeptidase [Chloroflexi bacterium]|nr:M67 family metallopeptidase [Chloroflexota bacterium]MCL4561661.1 M67 family metallopeptidase [Chloroflexota bacterium]